MKILRKLYAGEQSRVGFRGILGAFRILRRRAGEVGRPGLRVWADAGEVATQRAAGVIRDTAHRAETRAHLSADRIRAIVADRRVTRAELAELGGMPGIIEQVAGDCHDIGEVVS